jgi:protein TonB
MVGLGVQAEHCADPVATVEKVTHQDFQIIIIDWDHQPEARLLLTAARERKAAERPLTLAIVSDDGSVSQALQSGANSVLRKPIQVFQVQDTLTTARDLLSSKQAVTTVAQAAVAASASSNSTSTIPASMERGQEKTLRAGEFFQSATSAPGGHFITESNTPASLEPSPVEPVDPLADLEPTAASVAHEEPIPASPPPPQPTESRGLEWYKARLRTVPQDSTPAPAPTSPPSSKPELLGFDQAPSYADNTIGSAQFSPPDTPPINQEQKKQDQKSEQKKEAELFAYMAGKSSVVDSVARSRFPLKKAIIGAMFLAACAISVAPQAPWHPKLQDGWVRSRQHLHGWLNPQTPTTIPTVVAHEDFARAGDEYKLPVAEAIPDATTDPTQIQVLPVIDPTIKKTNNEGSNALQLPAAADPAVVIPSESGQPSGIQPAESQTSPPAPDTSKAAAAPSGEISGSHVLTAPVPTVTVHSDPFTQATASAPLRPAPPRNPEPHPTTVPGDVPSSLKSHMAPTTPAAGGNKAAETAMPSIEPVTVPEFTERALLIEQPAIAYPANARSQQGSVILQVLIGRDGSVQDAKFLQGSLLFARPAIDSVKSWKFKPYVMNSRPVSVQTLLTINFKP